MKKIGKILKKLWLPIVLVVGLLYLQAKCDLMLPDYTSKIVNIGIQQGGIETHVPEAIQIETYDHLKALMIQSDVSILEEAYEKISRETLSDKDYETYLKKYPILEKKAIYRLKENTEEIEDAIKIPLIMIMNLEQDTKEAQEMKKQILENAQGVTDIYQVFSFMSDEDKKEMFKEVTSSLEEMPDSILDQMAVQSVNAEYKKLDVDLDKIQLSYLFDKGLRMVGLAFLIMILAILVTFLSAQIGSRLARDLRSSVVHKVMDFSSKEFTEISQASLITRSTNDIQQIQMLVVMVLRILIYAPILGFGAITKVSGSSMAWVIALAVGLILSLVITLFAFALPKFQRVQKLVDKLNLVSREILTGLSVIRAFKTEKHEKKRFENANMDLTKTNLFVNRLMTIMMPTMMFIMNGVSILIIWVGAKKVDLGTMQVGDLMAFITYTMQIIMSFLMISMVSIMLPRAWISLKRVAEVLNKDISVKNKKETKEFDESMKGTVEFKDVYFRYPDAEEDILSNISFKATKGTTTAFIGSTGSGKSTLINLIPRFFDVTGGKILIDGVDIRDVKLEDLRAKIGYVPQKGMLFSGTIKSNILFGNQKGSEEDLYKAAKISQAEEFISEKEDQYDSEISQGGTNVSGGQKQRLSIARAIATNPEIYIFDDSFSALDYKTDHKLRKELAKETKNSTIFIVAQRISTILHADQIVVLDQGNVVGIGNHEELMKNCAVYKEIALSQLSKEELEHE
jgi:ATP-binding cassette subfamily B protein